MTNDKYQKQRIDNSFVKAYFNTALEELKHDGKKYDCKRLRYCNAWVYETEHFYLLKSYDTFVCAISKFDHVTYDALRMVYGYTSTSAQHIAKFIHDYTPYPWTSTRRTWRSID